MEVEMDNTSQKIIDATMSLVRDKGYVATTTKDIANLAGVNECTLFRKFQNKKDIVLNGIAQEKWRANITPEIFQDVRWELQSDLEMFMNTYMDRITPDFVNLSIGLRAPQLYSETAPMIMKIPQAFISSLIDYFKEMEQLGKIGHMDFESLAMSIFSSTFGYTFLKASFKQEISKVEQKEFIRNTVMVFVNGITKVK
jgi:AcrR family transcriptional regulator